MATISATSGSCGEQDEAAFKAGQLFDPAFLQMLGRFRVLRFMDWLNTNGSTLSSWSARPVPSYYSWTTGVPLEVVVALANAVSADAWLNVPAMADDDYVRQMAALVHAQLGPTQKVYLEYSNEVWNNSFPQYDYAVRRGRQAWPNRPSGTTATNGIATGTACAARVSATCGRPRGAPTAIG